MSTTADTGTSGDYVPSLTEQVLRRLFVINMGNDWRDWLFRSDTGWVIDTADGWHQLTDDEAAALVALLDNGSYPQAGA